MFITISYTVPPMADTRWAQSVVSVYAPHAFELYAADAILGPIKAYIQYTIRTHFETTKAHRVSY